MLGQKEHFSFWCRIATKVEKEWTVYYEWFIQSVLENLYDKHNFCSHTVKVNLYIQDASSLLSNIFLLGDCSLGMSLSKFNVNVLHLPFTFY